MPWLDGYYHTQCDNDNLIILIILIMAVQPSICAATRPILSVQGDLA